MIEPVTVLIESVVFVIAIAPSVSNPDVVVLPATVNVPPIFADSFTPNPPAVLIDPVVLLVEFTVEATSILPVALTPAKLEAPVTFKVPPICVFCAIPTPPDVFIEPLVEFNALVVFVTLIIPVAVELTDVISPPISIFPVISASPPTFKS